MSNVDISMSVVITADGRWIAYGRSDSTEFENQAVAKLLATTWQMEGPQNIHTVRASLPAPLEAEHAG